MPTDTRRITGPETSRSPYDFCPAQATDSLDLALHSGERPDGRSADQLRPLFLRAGVISQAKGSAYIEMSQTKIICAVYGPREVQRREDFSLKGQLTCDFKFTTFSSRLRSQHQQDNEEKDLSVQILEALEPAICLHKYPKAQINIFITVLQHDGAALSAAIVCASLALASAGIEMYDIVVASSAGIFSSKTFIDPIKEEEKVILKKAGGGSSGLVTVALMPSLNQVSAMTCDGEIPFDLLNKTMQACIANCQKLYPVVQQSLAKYVSEKRRDKEKT